jgi:ABC-type Fe3+ transport system substrate-binding protein
MARRYEAFGTVRRSRAGVSTTIAAVAVIVALAVAGVGGYYLRGGGSGSGSTITSTTTTATTVTQDLAAAAQAECTPAMTTCLTIMTTQDSANWANCYAPQFDRIYPWAAGKVDYVSLSAAALTTQLISGHQQHNVQGDIATGTLAGLIPAYQAGAFLNYTTPLVQFMNYTSDGYGPAWVTTNLAIVHMIYNPKVLSANNLPVPKSWSDLANPIYKNQIAFQTATSLSITTAEFYYLYISMGNASGSWNTLMKGIAANNPIITQTAGNAEQDVISGQAGIGIATFDNYVSDVKASGNASLAFADIEPIVYTPGVVAITADAPHPNMAKLFEAFYISIPGQTGVRCTNHDPYMSSLSTNLLAYLPSDYHLVNAYANTTLFSNTGAWSDTFKSIFGA